MKRVIYGLAALAFCAPLLANAAEGYVVADIGLQAGPDTDYPTITELSAGTPVVIQGCIDGWTWCDVIADRDRGWVPGTFLEEEYGGQRVIVMDYGPRIGIPVVGFSIAAYWDRHYHDRPFYAQRQTFETRAIHTHAPPRPSGVATTRSGAAQRSGTAAATTTTTPQQSATQRSGTSAATATTTRPTQSTSQRSVEQTTTAQQQRMKTQEQPISEERATQERTARQQRATTSERVPQTAQRTDETRPQKQGASKADQQRMAQQPRGEDTPANRPTETPPPHNPDEHAQSPRGAVTAKNQPHQKPEPKSKDELSKPKKDEKDNKDNGGGK